MKTTQQMIAMMFVLLATPLVRAEVPVPAGVFHGTVELHGTMARATDDVVVFARVAGQTEPVAGYRMGTLPTVGDQYVLQIPHELAADGQSAAEPQLSAGQSVDIYVLQDGYSEYAVAKATIPASGQVQELDLSASEANLVAQGSDTQLCGIGSAPCGGMGLLHLWIMWAGLRYVRRSRPKITDHRMTHSTH